MAVHLDDAVRIYHHFEVLCFPECLGVDSSHALVFTPTRACAVNDAVLFDYVFWVCTYRYTTYNLHLLGVDLSHETAVACNVEVVAHFHSVAWVAQFGRYAHVGNANSC